MECKNNTNKKEMSKFEKTEIKEKLENIINNRDIHNAIYIYTERKINNTRKLATGIGEILLLKKTVHEDIFFDIKKAILVPVIQLITYRIDTVLEDHDVNTDFPHICWISIYYINSNAVIIPVICKRDISLMNKPAGEIVIINPFSE